jgi:hypothetical protein
VGGQCGRAQVRASIIGPDVPVRALIIGPDVPVRALIIGPDAQVQAHDHGTNLPRPHSGTMHVTFGLRIAAVLLTALALVPAGAHLMELPNKVGLPQSAYFVVQGLYSGWWIGGLAWAAALIANAALAATLRRQGGAWRPAAIAAVLIAAAFGVFFAVTEPANRATAYWTFAAADWEIHRLRWEWSHALNAMLLFLALACATRAAVIHPR